jgi:hypothetical protein
MARSRAGRKRKSGERYACGKLRPAPDRGNDRLQALHARFRPFMQGKGDQWTGTPIGRAWLVGLLDGWDADPAAIRDAGLFYAERYWAYWPAPSGVSNYAAEDRRGGGSGWTGGMDPRGDRFLHLDRAIGDAGRACWEAVQALVVAPHWNPGESPQWLDRLINARLLAAGHPVEGAELPRAGDAERLKLAVEGLRAIVAGRRRTMARAQGG